GRSRWRTRCDRPADAARLDRRLAHAHDRCARRRGEPCPVEKEMAAFKRWVACLGLLLASAGWSAQATPPDKTGHVGLLLSGYPPHYVEAERAFVEGLRSVGYVEGKNLVIERRYGELQYQRMVGIARDLAAMNLDAIVTGCTGSTQAAQLA